MKKIGREKYFEDEPFPMQYPSLKKKVVGLELEADSDDSPNLMGLPFGRNIQIYVNWLPFFAIQWRAILSV